VGYHLSRLAEQDLIELFLDGSERFGLRQAEAYLDLLAHTFEFLADNPQAARLREEIDPPVRIHPVQAHLVVYRVDDDGDIFVIRVRHGHEDWVADES
jgi:toxin ParE1/3/4